MEDDYTDIFKNVDLASNRTYYTKVFAPPRFKAQVWFDSEYHHRMEKYTKDEIYAQYSEQLTRRLDDNILEQIFSTLGWTKVRIADKSKELLDWISETCKSNVNVNFGDNVVWFQNKDDAAWFKLQWASLIR